MRRRGTLPPAAAASGTPGGCAPGPARSGRRSFALLRPARGVALQPVPFHETVKRRAVDSREPRRLREVAPGAEKDPREEGAVEFGEQPIARRGIATLGAVDLRFERRGRQRAWEGGEWHVRGRHVR